MSHYKTIYNRLLLTKERIKSPVGWCVLFLVEAYVPLSDHVSGIAHRLELVGYGFVLQGQAIRLWGPDDAVLKAGVHLREQAMSWHHHRPAWFSEQ